MRRDSTSRSFERLFFFSSRRRHTRSLCDWSSDVCSSDLQLANAGDPTNDASLVWPDDRRTIEMGTIRSEERRVGKECRARWPQYDYEKTKELTRLHVQNHKEYVELSKEPTRELARVGRAP